MDFEPLLSTQVHPAIAAAARHCHEISANREMPRRQDFRPSQVRDGMGYLFLVTLLADEHEYYFPLGGEHIAVLFGHDLANMRLSQLGEETLIARMRRTYDFVLSKRTFQYIRGRYAWPDRAVDIERLLVPMTGKDGGVNTILGLVVPNVPSDMLVVYAGVGAATLEIDEEISGALPVS